MKIPIYEISTFAAAFYAGYNEGRGIDIGTNIKYLAEFGPTAFSIFMSLVSNKFIDSTYKFMKKKKDNLENENYKITKKDRTNVNYKDLSESDKLIQKEKIEKTANNLEKMVKKRSYIDSAITTGTITGAISFTGYAAGKIFSQTH